MTLEMLYQQIGGNYQDILQRLRKPERIEKFVLLFLKDDSFPSLERALEQGDVEAAFRAIHTLKGVCMNLSFDSLYQVSSQMTECLRAGDLPGAMELLPLLTERYECHCRAIGSYAGI